MTTLQSSQGTIQIYYPTDWTDYELIDSGQGAKLERFGPAHAGYIISRPDPRAIWPKANPDLWRNADAIHERTDALMAKWKTIHPPPKPWHVCYHGVTFSLRPTEFKHVGVFPEQAVNWDWTQQQISGRTPSVLNLFGYTGGATLFAAKAGAKVTHVDSARSAIVWAKENAQLSGLSDKPIRWIEDDAYKFVIREGRRGSTYDGIIMDPPRFGRGAKGEVWKIEKDLPKLLDAAMAILSKNPLFFLINAYTADLSPIALYNIVESKLRKLGGTLTFGELALEETQNRRLLPNGIFVRWNR